MISSSTKVGLPQFPLKAFTITNSSIIGEGIIILLCGPPGVGKTLTAEAGRLGNGLVVGD
jgi:SpoVK/Ycf46/Vps4 family AAA+-type ATPase